VKCAWDSHKKGKKGAVGLGVVRQKGGGGSLCHVSRIGRQAGKKRGGGKKGEKGDINGKPWPLCPSRASNKGGKKMEELIMGTYQINQKKKTRRRKTPV